MAALKDPTEDQLDWASSIMQDVSPTGQGQLDWASSMAQDEQQDFQQQSNVVAGEPQEPEEKSRWSVPRTPVGALAGYILGEPEKGESFLRGVVGPVKEFVLGGLEAATSAFGGGPGSLMEQDELFRSALKQEAYNIRRENLEDEGLSPEEITSSIGSPPPETLSIRDFIDKMTSNALVPQTEVEKRAQAAGKAAGEFVGLEALLPGASSLKKMAQIAKTGGLFGLGEELAEQKGAGHGGQFATGLAFAFGLKGAKGAYNVGSKFIGSGKSLMTKAVEFGRGLLRKPEMDSIPKFLTEKGTRKSLAELELTGKRVAKKIETIGKEKMSEFNDMVNKFSPSATESVRDFQGTDYNRVLIKNLQNRILDTVSGKPPTTKKGWESVQKWVNDEFYAVRRTYKSLYNVVEKDAKNFKETAPNTLREAKKISLEIQKGLIKNKDIDKIKSISKGLTKSLTKTKKVVGEDGKTRLVKTLRNIRADRLLASKRSLNRILGKVDILPEPVDLLRPLSKALRKDITSSLSKNQSVIDMFESAESIFKQTQELYNNKQILGLRESLEPEKLGRKYSSASNLEFLKNSIGKKNKSMNNLVDRLVLESLVEQGQSKLESSVRELSPYLTADGKKAISKLVDQGDKLTSPGQQAILRGSVVEEIQKFAESGATPNLSLSAMQSPQGYSLIKNTFSHSENGKKIWKGLQRMYVEDMFSSMINKNGQLDFQHVKDVMKDPHNFRVLKESLGKEGVQFFQTIDTWKKNFAENMSIFENRQKSLYKKILNSVFSDQARTIIYTLSPFFPVESALLLTASEGVSRLRSRRLYKILSDKKKLGILRDLGKRKMLPADFEEKLKTAGKILSVSRDDSNDL